MTTKTPHTVGRFCWHELATSEPKKALGFYGELLGWKSREMDMGPAGAYTIVSAGDKDVGGITRASGAPSWLPYCTVADVDATLKLAKNLGATIEAPAVDVPGVGRYATIQDAQGARIAPIKMLEEAPEGAGAPPRGTFCWTELLSTDPAASVKVYQELFGWKAQGKDMGPMGTYHVMLRGEQMAAGIMKTPVPGKAAWLSYVVVDEVDGATKRAAKLGGQVMMEPADIPEIGRFSVVTDPQGAAIALFTGAEK